MGNSSRTNHPKIPVEAHYILQGSGEPVILIHGMAASLHDWDALVPALLEAGYATYAVDLLGHGDSPKAGAPLYEMDWLVDHFVSWMDGLKLERPAVLVGHSLGGYVALEYARRLPERVRGLVLVDPFYSKEQLPPTLQLVYAHPRATAFVIGRTPMWLLRPAIYLWSATMGHRSGGLHALSKAVREQTALDYMRTDPAAYGILRGRPDLTPFLAAIRVPTLVVWGAKDNTLAPRSFGRLVERMPRASGASIETGHVPHLADERWFNEQVLAFLGLLDGGLGQIGEGAGGATDTLRAS